MRISDWSSDVCSSDLADRAREEDGRTAIAQNQPLPEVLLEQRAEQEGKEQRSKVEPALAQAIGEEPAQDRHADVENAVVNAESADDAENENGWRHNRRRNSQENDEDSDQRHIMQQTEGNARTTGK